MNHRKKIIAGNWKMNMNFPESTHLVQELLQLLPENNKITKILFPAYPFLSNCYEQVRLREDIHIGAQNCSNHASGAYTGEVSIDMIKSCGGEYVLVGHSERRSYFREDSAVLKLKIDACLANSIIPVFCIGEKLDEREKGLHFDLIEGQLKECLFHLPKENIKNIVLAYEPVWAIGTGLTATPDQAQEMHSFIRDIISSKFGMEAAMSLSILYGGSCNASNANDIFSCHDIDGGLIGGASLKAVDFATIASVLK